MDYWIEICWQRLEEASWKEGTEQKKKTNKNSAILRIKSVIQFYQLIFDDYDSLGEQNEWKNSAS